MRRPGGMALLLAAMAVGTACKEQKAPEAGMEVPAAPAASGFGPASERLKALVAKWGPDAWRRPEVEGILRELDAVSAEAADYLDAQALAQKVRIERRVALGVAGARDAALGLPAAEQPSYAPLRMEGAVPAETAAAESLKVGSSRAALLEAYGECLVRQTWFRGRDGGATVELFQVGEDCRQRFKPRYYSVSSERITEIREGNLDRVGTVEAPAGGGGRDSTPR